jgi:hypothetical protein
MCIATLSQPEQERAMGGSTIRTLGQCSAKVPTLGCLGIVRQGLVSGLICFD